jgi:hypothetical protein
MVGIAIAFCSSANSQCQSGAQLATYGFPVRRPLTKNVTIGGSVDQTMERVPCSCSDRDGHHIGIILHTDCRAGLRGQDKRPRADDQRWVMMGPRRQRRRGLRSGVDKRKLQITGRQSQMDRLGGQLRPSVDNGGRRCCSQLFRGLGRPCSPLPRRPPQARCSTRSLSMCQLDPSKS